MSAIQAAFLFAGLLLVAAGWIAVTTWRARRRAVVWLVPPDSHLAHAFRLVEVKTFYEVTALRHCGTWLVAELREDEHATRCAPCACSTTLRDEECAGEGTEHVDRPRDVEPVAAH